MILRGSIAALLLATAAARAAGPFGSDQSGLPMTSAVFRAWASRVVAVAHPIAGSGGFANDDSYEPSDASAVLGRPDDEGANNAHVFSLGNGGSVVVAFDEAIHDGSGPDFAVFENGFSDGTPRIGDTNRYTFAELAFVEVATTTNAWACFPSQYFGTNFIFNFNGMTNNNWASQDVTLIDGLAGKHVCELGTPFDLSALRNLSVVTNGSVNLNNIRFVRITDVIGDGSRLDSSNRPIYDPYFSSTSGWPNGASPSAFDGFDLRAVGLINSGAVWPSSDAGGISGMKLTWFAATNVIWQPQSAVSLAGPWTNFGAPFIGNDSSVTVTAAPSFFRVQHWRAP